MTDVKIDNAHRSGTGRQRPMVIRLSNMKQKSRIFGNIKKLKGLKNEHKRFYRIDDQLPDELKAKKKHMLYHLKDIKNTSQGQRIEAKFKKSQLYIEKKPYTKEVTPPRPTDMLFAP